METINLAAQLRDGETKAKKIRTEGMIPAVVYGHNKKNENLKIDYQSFVKTYREAGLSSLVDLAIGKKPSVKVLISDIQKDPVRGDYIHIDFYKIKMDEEITTTISLTFKGVSKAVKELEGILVKNIDELEISCLPKDLPSKIEVDISSLNTFDDSIHIKDIKLPSKVTTTSEPDDVVAIVTPPRSEEELEALEEEVESDVDDVEVTGEKVDEEGEEKGEETEEKSDGDKEKKGDKDKDGESSPKDKKSASAKAGGKEGDKKSKDEKPAPAPSLPAGRKAGGEKK